MGNPDTYSWLTGEPDDQAEQRFRPPLRSYQPPADYPTRPRPYANPVQQPYANPVQQP